MASMYILLFLLLVSLISVGVGWGSYIEINNKMEDPFIKFMDIKMPGFATDAELKTYIQKLNKDTAEYNYSPPVALRFDIHSFVGYDKTGKLFNDDKMLKVMSFDQDNKFYDELKNSRVASKSISFKDDEWGCVITESGLKALGLDMSNSHIFWQIDTSHVPLPISGVVSRLRGGNDILVSKKLYQSFKYGTTFDNELYNTSYLMYSINSTGSFKSHDNYNELKDLGFERLDSKQESIINSHTSNFHIIVKYLSSNERDSIQDIVSSMDIEMIQVYDLENAFRGNNKIQESMDNEGRVDKWTIMFNDLELVESFVDNVSNNYKNENEIRSRIEIDHSIVQTKKQFEFFRILVIMLAGALCVFSFISIVFFILNLMLSHIKNNKKNLGTLKAFGFSNSNIILTYSCITCCVVLVAFVLSYFLSELLGPSVLSFVSDFTNNELITDVKYQNLGIYYLVFGLVILPSFFITWRVYSFLNKVTPGDLIYERR